MKLFRCIVNDGENIFVSVVAGKNKKAMLKEYGGNGEFEKVEDVTRSYLNDTSVDKLATDLAKMGWGEGERNLICALVNEHLAKMNK